MGTFTGVGGVSVSRTGGRLGGGRCRDCVGIMGNEVLVSCSFVRSLGGGGDGAGRGGRRAGYGRRRVGCASALLPLISGSRGRVRELAGVVRTLGGRITGGRVRLGGATSELRRIAGDLVRDGETVASLSVGFTRTAARTRRVTDRTRCLRLTSGGRGAKFFGGLFVGGRRKWVPTFLLLDFYGRSVFSVFLYFVVDV